LPTKRSPIRKCFRQREHIKRRGDISRIFKKGRSVTCLGAKLFYLDNGLSHNRIVFTFARKYGNAVRRNRAKRLGREAYRQLSSGLKTGYDMVLLVYPPPAVEGKPGKPVLSDRVKQFEILLRKAKLEAPSGLA
jgi:ribonuclease P protein component